MNKFDENAQEYYCLASMLSDDPAAVAIVAHLGGEGIELIGTVTADTSITRHFQLLRFHRLQRLDEYDFSCIIICARCHFPHLLLLVSNTTTTSVQYLYPI